MEENRAVSSVLLCYFGSNDHVTSSGVTGGVGYWVWRPFKCVDLTHFKRLNWIFVHFCWICNMKLCIFPQNARDFIPDSSNITYNSEERAQARLCSSAPCLGLSYISIQWTVQCSFYNIHMSTTVFGDWEC